MAQGQYDSRSLSLFFSSLKVFSFRNLGFPFSYMFFSNFHQLRKGKKTSKIESKQHHRQKELVSKLLQNSSSFPYKLHQQCIRDFPSLSNGTVPELQNFFDSVRTSHPANISRVMGENIYFISSFFTISSPQRWILNSTDGDVYHVAMYPSFSSTTGMFDTITRFGKNYVLLPEGVDLNATVNDWVTISEKLAVSAKSGLQKYQRFQRSYKDLLDKGIMVRMSREELQDLMPNLDWNQFFLPLETDPRDFIIYVPEYFSEFSDFLGTIISSERYLLAFKLFLQYRVLLELELFFWGLGPDVNKDCEITTRSTINRELENDYAALYVTPKTKTLVAHFTFRILRNLASDFGNLSWIDEVTREGAEEKVSKFDINIAGPKSDAYSLPDIPLNQSFIKSWWTLQKARTRTMFKLASKPIDPKISSWDRLLFSLSPVNAYYIPLVNGIYIEAPIMVDPFIMDNVPLFYQYGAIGTVLGHEATHGFDNSGSQFDGDGKFVNWWSDESRKEFDKRTECLATFYNNSDYHLEYSGGQHIDGNLTLGENIADLGGVKFAYLAWQEALAQGEEKFSESDIEEVFGMSSKKLFFLSFSQLWCDAYIPREFSPDVHSPSPQRVYSLANSPFFQEAWQCPVGSRFNPKEKCLGWGTEKR
eukprot:TRINITY_DN9429_c0_g1_i3.p1 TRINITY_DN9429_c0_g1~~TRINITY_DN9429_c0_g1_i3.p1  ORF type:complete len:647 (-),score=134.51 TRINITY_DN9429_c0_g1_i3:2134-4074(-)